MTISNARTNGKANQFAVAKIKMGSNRKEFASQTIKRLSSRSLVCFSVLSSISFMASTSLNASTDADLPALSFAQDPFGSQIVLASSSRKEKVIPLFAVKQAEDAKKKAPNYLQGEVVAENDLPKAYNAPSGTVLKGKNGKWIPDLFIDLAFIYYHASEEGLDLAESATFVESTTTVLAPAKSKVLQQSFNYQPGFKVGIGTNICDWNLFAQYTWIRQKNHTDKKPPTPTPNVGEGVWFMNDWFTLGIPVEGQSLPATKVNSKWHLDMNVADLTLGRPYYVARNVSIAPYFGLRGAWINQRVNVKINVPTLNTVANQRSKVFSHNSSDSWAIGPRAGLGAALLFPKGFRFQGDLSGSVLYTDYTSVKHSEQVVNAANNPSTIQVKQSNIKVLRPVAEIGLGLGWGTYFHKQKAHFDLSINYDFSVWWNQNMIRKLLDETALGSGASAGDINLHGLDVAVRFDF